jgi:cobalamin synthase
MKEQHPDDQQSSEQPPKPQGGGEPPDWREARRQERERRRAERRERGSGWIIGAVLVLLGIIFLLQTLNISYLQNWWALFILIPAFGAFAGAWRIYEETGKITPSMAGPIVGGLLLLFLTVLLLFNLPIGPYWPVLLIAIGVAILLGAFSSRR